MIWFLIGLVILQFVMLTIILLKLSVNRSIITGQRKDVADIKRSLNDVKALVSQGDTTPIGNRAILRNIEKRLSVIECTLKGGELEFEHYKVDRDEEEPE